MLKLFGELIFIDFQTSPEITKDEKKPSISNETDNIIRLRDHIEVLWKIEGVSYLFANV